MEIALVTWNDSATRGRWAGREEYSTERPILIRSTGFVLEKNSEFITLVQSESDNGLVSDSVVIPQGCVIQYTVLGVTDDLS